MGEEKQKCEKCGNVVSAKVKAYSKEHFEGRVLCFDCQKSADLADAEKGAAKKGTLGDYTGRTDDIDPDSDEFAEDMKNLDEELDKNEEALSSVKNEIKKDEAEVVDAEIVEEKRKAIKSVEMDEGTFVFRREGGKLLCRNGTEGEEYEVKPEIPECSCPRFQKYTWCVHVKAAIIGGYAREYVEEQKQIAIDWKKIPVHVLIPKLRKALEYVSEDKTGFYAVIKASFEGKEHRTTSDSCDCDDFMYRGTSLNPCVHQIRIKYTDDEIRAKLTELGADELRAPRKKGEEIEMREKVVDIAVQETTTDLDMMIQGMTPQLAEVGKIKIGVKGDKMVRGHLLPQKLDHFRIATLMKDDDGRLVMDDAMNNIIGEKCTSLDICLCYDDFTMNMTSSYSWFAQSKLVCMGNGQTAMRRKEDGSEEKIICNPKECTAYKEKKCLPYGRLSVILAAANRIGGVYVLRTHGWNTIRNVLSSMAFIRKEAGGVLAGLSLRMRLLPMTVTPRDVGRNVKIYSVNIEYPGTLSELKQAGADEMERRLKLGINMKQTEDRYRESVKARMKEEAEEDARDIADEFEVEGEG